MEHMHLSPDEIDRIAGLARLELTDAEKTAFGTQLEQVLGYVQKLKGLHTDGVAATATVVEQASVYRADEMRPSLSVEEALANAPDAQDRYFCVPRIIQEP
jgi:aspartyl-tRNA(Asn)/glutamyl-tRNA(Gln) amidotransferase subunit C